MLGPPAQQPEASTEVTGAGPWIMGAGGWILKVAAIILGAAVALFALSALPYWLHLAFWQPLNTVASGGILAMLLGIILGLFVYIVGISNLTSGRLLSWAWPAVRAGGGASPLAVGRLARRRRRSGACGSGWWRRWGRSCVWLPIVPGW